MIFLIKKIIKYYFLKKRKKNIILVLPNKYYINLIKQIYVKYINKNKKYCKIPNIFISKKKLIEKISNLKINNNKFYFLKYLLYKYKKFKKFRYYTHNKIHFFLKLLDTFDYIDTELIDFKKIIKNYKNYYNISKWLPNISKKKNYKKNYFIYKLYKNLTLNLLNKKCVYYGLALKIAVYKLNSFIKKNKKKKYYFLFIGNNYLNKTEKIIKENIINNNLGKIYYNLKFKKLIFKKNKIKIIKTTNYFNKYKIINNIIINNYKKNKPTTILLTDHKKDLFLFNLLYTKIENKINYNFNYKIDKLILHNVFLNFFYIKNNIKKKFLFNFLIDFFKNTRIIKLISKNRYIKILNFLKDFKKQSESSYIYIKYKKIIKNTILLNFFNNNNNVLYFLKNLKKIINFILRKIKINILEYIYLLKINNFIIYIYKLYKRNFFNKNKIKTLFYLFKYYINYNNNINFFNINYKNNIDIFYIKFIFKNLIINNYKNILIIFNKKYNFIIKRKYYFYNIINKILYLNNKIININFLYKLLKISNTSYIINNIYEYNIINRKIILYCLYNNKNIKLINCYNKNYYYKNIKYNIYFKKKIIKNFKLNTGFTYTSLNKFINNPIEFYYKYILININNYEDEYDQPKIFGIIIHNILYKLYIKYININLNIKHILKIKNIIKYSQIIKKNFLKFYNYNYIKNDSKLYYLYNISKKILLKFIKNDELLITKGNNIKIISLENFNNIKINNNNNNNDSILIKGKIDRIDKFNNTYRIIDYKSYLFVKKKNVFIYKDYKSFDILFIKKEYENILQLLIYSLILFKKIKKNLYTTIYLPYNIKNLKINNNLIIDKNLIINFEHRLYYILNNILKKKYVLDFSNF